MNFKTTLILLAVLVLAAGAYVYVERSQKPPAPPEDATTLSQGRKLFDASSGDVTRVSIAEPGGTKTVFERDPSDFKKWLITQPINAPANATTVDSFVRDVLGARSSTQLDNDNATTGLDKPRYHVELTTSGPDAKPIVFDVGKQNAVGDAIFVKVAGADKVDEIPTALQDQIDKKLEDWRDKRLLNVTAADVKQIQIDHAATPGKPAERLDLARTDTAWDITGPRPMPADQTSVDSLINAMVFMEATDFVKAGAPALKFSELDQPRLTLRFSTAVPTTSPSSNAPATQPTLGGTVITFGGYDDARKQNVYARVSNSPQVVKVAAALLASFEKSPLDLRNREVLNIDPIKVSEVSLRIDRPATTQPTSLPAEEHDFDITRRKENLIFGPALPAGPTPPTTAPSPAAAAPVPATAPSTRPSTAPAGASSRADLLSPFLALAGEVTATAPATLPTTRPATTQPATEPAVAATTAPATAPSIHVEAPVLPVVPSPPTSKWVLQSQNGAAADDEQVTDLLEALHPLKVEKYLESAPTTQPTANYVLTIKTIGAGGADTADYELQIVDPGGDARLIGHYKDLTFELDRSLLKKLDGDFKTKRPPEPVSAPPPNFHGGGGFPGGFSPGGG